MPRMCAPDFYFFLGPLAQALPCRFTMVAVVPMFDPPRHDTKETIERCIEKGIMVKMVTGDQLLIGKETAKQLGMGQNFYTTEELMEVRHMLSPSARC